MKALWYTFFPMSSTPRSLLTVVWVPDAELQFQWTQPYGAVQMTHASQPTPPHEPGELVEKYERYLPYPLVRAARNYLEKQEHLRARRAVIQSATDRIQDEAIRNEGRLQAAASKFLLDKSVEERRVRK